MDSTDGYGCPVMSNASRILCTLDRRLDHPVRLVLYGRAALQLGFANAPAETAFSKDVDAIIPLGDHAGLSQDERFWDALEATNIELQSAGLYLTHLFRADQVFLRPHWETHLVPLAQPETHALKLFRPATLDLLLTKMMRGADAQDMADAQFLIRHDRLSPAQLEQAIAEVQGPDLPELWETFEQAIPIVLAYARAISTPSPLKTL